MPSFTFTIPTTRRIGRLGRTEAQNDMLANSKNIVITGGTFVEVAPVQGTEFQTLCRHIAVGALLDSGERFNPPRCHPETRKVLLSTVLAWIKDTDRKTLILWLKGSAGSGKSALAQSIAEQCRELDLPAAASFFFSRRYPERRLERFLCPTISYQIALTRPGTRGYIENVILLDPSIFALDFRTQFRELIVGPLIMAQKGNHEHGAKNPQLVILDGLDECHDPKVQGYILDVITQEIQRCDDLPLIFIITSRPEEHICIKFASGMLNRITLPVSLEDYFGAYDDIRIFIKSGFDEIKRSHPIRHHLPSTWPPEGVIEELVKKSSGQFVYASIVVEYVSSNRHRPSERLDIIRGLASHDGDSPFTELDALYKHVCSLVIYRKPALQIMSALILMDLKMSHDIVEKLLSLQPGDVKLYLGGLASLIDFQDHQKPIKVLHSSLRDFLLDSDRSTDFSISEKLAHADIATACLRQLEVLEEEPILIDYACYNIETHLDSSCGTTGLHEALSRFHLGKFHNAARNILLQQNTADLQITLEDIWYFVPTFLDCIRNNIIFDDWETMYNHHAEVFDQHLEQELDKYTGDSRLRDLVTMLTIFHSPITVKNLEDAPLLNDALLQLDVSTADHLVLIDEGSLNIRHMVRRHGQSEAYIELLCQFLEDPLRSGRHFIDGEKYAISALRCSEQIAKPFPHAKDERDLEAFIWSLECTPALLLHAAYDKELVMFLEKSHLGTIPPQNQHSFYPALSRMVKEARVAYLIFSSFAMRNLDICTGHASQFSLVSQGLKLIPTQADPSNETRPTLLKFDDLLLFPLSAAASFCCVSRLLSKYFLHSQVSDIHYPLKPSRIHDQPQIIIHVENPFPEIDAQPRDEVSTSSMTSSLGPTMTGVIKILAYRIWRDLVQDSGT